MSSPLDVPPSRTFWLDGLRFPEFDDAVELTNDPPALVAACEEAFDAPGGPTALAAVRQVHGDEPATLANLVLVGRFLRQRKAVAVAEVAQGALPPDVVQRLGKATKAPRLPLGVALYERDPWHLLDVDICHRWHARRRCALVLQGPRRVLPGKPRELNWGHVAGVAQRAAAQVVARVGGALQFRRHIFRKVEGEVLLAWSELADRDTVRSVGGQVTAGHHDEWTILRVHRDGNRIDVTGPDLLVGQALADGVAHALWGGGSYRVAREPLTDDALAEFLDRLCDPDDDTFRLLELVGEIAGLPERPVLTVSNAGQARVERSVRELRRTCGLACDWRTVHRVKIGFDASARVEVHFPVEGEDLVLTYSDLERDKEVTAAFEALLRDELGVEVHPKVARQRRPARVDPPEPRRLAAGHYMRLVAEVVDRPATWELAALESLAERGLVAWTAHAVFRCGDAVLRGRPDTLDCHGEIEMPHGLVDAADPLRQPEEAEHTCAACGAAWYPGRFRPPAWERVRVHVDAEGAWRHLLDLLPELTEDERGVASGPVRGRRAQLVFLPLAEADPWFQPDLATSYPTVWVSVPGDPRLAVYGDRGLTLPDLLAEGGLAARRILDLGRAPRAAHGTAFLAASPDPSPWVSSAQAPAAPKPTPSRHVLSLDDQGVWLDGTLIAVAKASGVRFFLALLAAAASKDDATGQGRRFHSVHQLHRLVGGTTFADGDLHQWVSRTRSAIRTEFTDEDLPELVIEGDKGGYRLGPSVTATGFDLTAELANRQRRRGKGPR